MYLGEYGSTTERNQFYFFSCLFLLLVEKASNLDPLETLELEAKSSTIPSSQHICHVLLVVLVDVIVMVLDFLLTG